MTDLLVGLAIGLTASLIAWWIVTRAVRPNMVFDPTIGKRPDDTGRATWRYIVRVVNRRRWWLPHDPIIDVNISAALRIKGLHQRDRWTVYRVPIGSESTVDIIEKAKVFRLRVYDISQRASDFRVLPDEIQAAIARGDVELESLLAAGTDAELRVMVSGAHSYTLARSARFAHYGLADIQSVDAAPPLNAAAEDPDAEADVPPGATRRGR